MSKRNRESSYRDEEERRRRMDDVNRQREGRWQTNPERNYGWLNRGERLDNSWSYGRPDYPQGISEDWRHLNTYWNDTYGENYPGSSEFIRERRDFTGRGPRNYKRSDERILEDINEQLTRHPGIDATDIEVIVKDGEVTLRGHVDHRQTKRMADDIAEGVSGVKNVRNELRVQPPTQQKRDENAA
jgi:hypothetical protein